MNNNNINNQYTNFLKIYFWHRNRLVVFGLHLLAESIYLFPKNKKVGQNR